MSLQKAGGANTGQSEQLGPEQLRKLWELEPVPQTTLAGMPRKRLFGLSLLPQINSNTSFLVQVNLVQEVKRGVTGW